MIATDESVRFTENETMKRYCFMNDGILRFFIITNNEIVNKYKNKNKNAK